ncbi:MAG: hypothetical protein LBR14_03665 [Clostridiales Family XIII bacterium]|jgi:hypothetical protein|nr:hypothetical protein [Clostridiales Family XIII bacterium]
MNSAISKITERRGSLAVEAAIFVPLFLLAVLALAALIRMTAANENATNALTDETRLLAAEAQVPIRLAAFKSDLAERILEENPDAVGDVKVDSFLYRLPQVDLAGGRVHDNVIRTDLRIDYLLAMPVLPLTPPEGKVSVAMRAFVGSERNASAFPFDDMEKNESSKKVWVFPRAGTKYHAADCRFIANEPHEAILTASIRKKYTPCKNCHPEKLRDGALIYYFPSSGHAYHTGKCPQVEKYVMEVSQQEAERNGYTACATCGGGV